MKTNLKKLICSDVDPFKVPWGLKDIILIVIFYNLLTIPLHLLKIDENKIQFEYAYSLILISGIIFYIKYRFKAKLDILGIKKGNFKTVIINGLLFGFITFLIVAGIPFTLHRFINSLLSIDVITALKMVFVVMAKSGILYLLIMPFSEELFFRGIIYSSLRKRFNILLSATSCSIIFAVIHIFSFDTFTFIIFLQIFLGSVVFSLTYEKHHSIFIPTLAHSFYNYLIRYSDFAIYLSSK